jgi:lysophospholipase L1-like esterase
MKYNFLEFVTAIPHLEIKPYALKWIKNTLLIVGVAHLLLWLCWGITSFITTLTLYVIIGCMGIFFLRKIASNITVRQHLSLVWISTLLGLIVLEGAVRYVFKWHLSYHERTGLFMSSSISNVGSYDILLKDSIQTFNGGNQEVCKSIEDYTYCFTTNALGLRGPEPDFQEGRFNFIALGDSYTESYGSKDDSTWPDLLAQKIKTATKRPVSYVNAGVSGADPFTQFNSLLWLIDRYPPDIVILCITSSDIYDYTYRSGKIGWPEKILERAYNVSFLWRVFVREVLHRDALFWTASTQEQHQSASLKAIATLMIERYHPFLQAQQIPFLAVAIPSQWELEQGASAFSPLEAAFQGTEVPFVDLFHSFQEYGLLNKVPLIHWYYPSDGHFKPQANEVLAELLLQQLLPH